jgi:hypothetical protein
VALAHLDEVNDRVGCYVEIQPGSLQTAHHIDHVPATLQEVFDLASVVPARHRIYPAREEQFHGDGRGGDVNVVLIDGALHDNLNAALTQTFGERTFSASQLGQRVLPDPRFHHEFDVARFATTACLVRSLDENLALFGRERLSAENSSRAVAAHLNTSIAGDPSDGLVTEAKARAYGERALSQAIGFNNITRKRVFDFSGHVFNLQTRHEWYGANGIVAHNCTWGIMAKAFAPLMDVEHAQQKALAASHSMRLNAGANPHTDDLWGTVNHSRQEDLTFNDAVIRLQKMRPHLSKSICSRIVRYAMYRCDTQR